MNLEFLGASKISSNSTITLIKKVMEKLEAEAGELIQFYYDKDKKIVIIKK